MKPNYITEINRFYDWIETNQIGKSAIALWNALMHIANKTGWKENFTVAMSVLETKTGFKRSELFKARNTLRDFGRIKWIERGGNLCAEYQIVFFSVHNTDANSNSKGTQTHTQMGTQTHTINITNSNKNKLEESENKSISTPSVSFLDSFKSNDEKKLTEQLMEVYYKKTNLRTIAEKIKAFNTLKKKPDQKYSGYSDYLQHIRNYLINEIKDLPDNAALPYNKPLKFDWENEPKSLAHKNRF